MAEYIDREKMLKYIEENNTADEWIVGQYNADWIYSFIESQPTADVVEAKHGEWIYNTDDFTPKMRCSVCGYNKPIAAGENIEQQPSDYCNKCGAKMDGERK